MTFYLGTQIKNIRSSKKFYWLMEGIRHPSSQVVLTQSLYHLHCLILILDKMCYISYLITYTFIVWIFIRLNLNALSHSWF